MKTLAVESSGKSCSVAVADNNIIIADIFLNNGLTHSQTLSTMIDFALISAKVDIRDIDLFAVANGPGSFTGVRIGVSNIKGLAQPLKTKCAPVSTLAAIAFNLIGINSYVCTALDARCSQFYYAIFKCDSDKAERLSPDSAGGFEEIINTVTNVLKPTDSIILAGDGAEKLFEFFNDSEFIAKLTPETLRLQRAAGVCKAATSMLKSEYCSADDLQPFYLRPPQAERNLKKGIDNK